MKKIILAIVIVISCLASCTEYEDPSPSKFEDYDADGRDDTPEDP